MPAGRWLLAHRVPTRGDGLTDALARCGGSVMSARINIFLHRLNLVEGSNGPCSH